jgi:hypothetical protein
LKAETCLCLFEKNRCRLAGFVPERAAFVRFGSVVASMQNVNWKVKVKLPPTKTQFASFNADLIEIK